LPAGILTRLVLPNAKTMEEPHRGYTINIQLNPHAVRVTSVGGITIAWG
jgi:hypothetical protein